MNSWWEKAVEAWGETLLGEHPVFHMLRHGYVMEMLKKMPVHWIASQTGHRNSRQIEQRYGVLRGQAEEQARALINASGLVLG
jgi:integrase